MSSSKKLRVPEVRPITRAEAQQLTDLADEIATKILGPDWKGDHGEAPAQSNSESKDQAADQAGND
jgi:hypothetical protein